MKFVVRIVAVLVSFFLTFQLFAARGADFIVVVDQSRSIKESLPNIKDFISKRIFHSIARPEDRVHLLSFDGQFYERDVLLGDADIFEVGYSLDAIQPVGGYTDLTNAVIQMNGYIKTHTEPRTRKIVFFLTDGLNEPPAYSAYQGKLRHSFFEKAMSDQQDGDWTVFVTGIGETDAEQLAGMIGAEYVAMSEKPTLDEFDSRIAEKLEAARSRNNNLVLYIAASSVVLCAAGSFAALKRYSII
ncbi:MAG: VWA domain-containing protein [Spirochaetota bacterium]